VQALNGRATRQQIRDHIVAAVPEFNDRNVDPDLSMLTVNSFARGNFSPNKKPRRTDDGSPYDALYLEPADNEAEYVVYDPRKHGVWEIAKSADADEDLLRPALVNELLLRSSIEEEQSAAERSGAFDASDEKDARRKVLAAIVRRQGQAQFRRSLLKAYNGKCAVTGCPVVDVLEAAHIKPYLGPYTNSVQNGLLLRADVHTLFDLGLLRIDADRLTVALASRLIGKFQDVVEGAPLLLPVNKADWPDAEALRHHGEQSIAF
jgi:predicted restriction endonuclease